MTGSGPASVGLSATAPMSIEVQHLFDMHLDLAPPQLVAAPAATRMIFVVERGVVAGPRLAGRVLPGGGDWLLLGSDRVGRTDLRATIETDDGALISVRTAGVIALSDEALHRYLRGQDVPWSEAYARSAPLFETGDGRYLWLNATCAIALSELGPEHIDYRVFGVL